MTDVTPIGLTYCPVLRRRRLRVHWAWPIAAISLYVGVYAVAYAGRLPAANLMYWYYTDSAVVTDECLFRFFYPAYWVHTRLLGAGRHEGDRPYVLTDDDVAGV